MTRKPLTFDLNPLFSGPTMEARSRLGSPFRLLRLSEIDVDPDQPRRVFNSDALAELAASIKEFGVLCPVLVKVTAGGTYKLIAGERRYRACKLLGLETIPAIVEQDEEEGGDSLGKQLVENVQREDLSPMEKALAIGQLRDRLSLSVRDLAARLGLSKSAIQRSLEILSLPDDLHAALIAGAAESKVLLLSQIKDREHRKKIIPQLDDLSRTQIEALVAHCQETSSDQDSVSHRGTRNKVRESVSESVEDRRIAEDIQRALGTKVQLLRNSKKPAQGKLSIEFYSGEDLDEIYRRLAYQRS